MDRRHPACRDQSVSSPKPTAMAHLACIGRKTKYRVCPFSRKAYFDLDGLRSDNLEIPHPQGNISIKLPTQFDTSKPLRDKSKGYNNVGDMFVKLFVRFNRN